MPFVAIDDSIAFAIDAPIKSSDIRQLDQNVDYLKALFNITTGHDHGGGTDAGKPVASVANDSITEAKINWASAGGITQFSLGDNEISEAPGTSQFVTVATTKIYVPPNANSLEYMLEMKADSTGGGSLYGRINVGGVTGATVTIGDTATYTWGAVATCNISTLSGWQTVDIQVQRHTGKTIYVRGKTGRII